MTNRSRELGRGAPVHFLERATLNGLRVLMALLNNWDLTDEKPMSKARGNLRSYSHSKFITNVTADSVDVGSPRRDSFFFLATPHEFFKKLKLRAIGKNISTRRRALDRSTAKPLVP
jgi:hypothetical protein